jgi:trk system potassium uptake protein
MNVMIIGGGSVGRYMAEQLVAGGEAVTLVDNDSSVVDKWSGRSEPAGVHWVLGDACEPTVLDDAGIRDADVVASVTGDDEDNLVVSLLAKQEFGVPRVVARVNNPRNEWMFNETWGVDVSVSTPHLLTGLVQEAVTTGSLVRLLALEGNRVQLDEVTLTATSIAVGKTIGDVGLPRESTVVAVVRDGHVVVPNAELALRDGDEVMVLLDVDAELEVRQRLVG